jgi:branched-chain amino acid transport system ATP-binding protein/sulfate-transporting ATPase
VAAVSLLLEAKRLTRRFGGVVALDCFDLGLEPNEILGLIGPNGSGKTTFFNVVTGIYSADGGSVTFDHADITNASPRAVYNAGIARTFQRSRLSLPLSIFDNIMIGTRPIRDSVQSDPTPLLGRVRANYEVAHAARRVCRCRHRKFGQSPACR